MPKPDPALLEPSRYPYCCTIEPRFGDLDPNRHINNVAMASYLEDARVRFYSAAGFETHLRGLSVMIVSLNIEYLGEAHYPQPLEIHCAIERVGRTSLTLVHVVRQGGRDVAFARCVMVAVNGRGETETVPLALENAMLRP